MTAISTGSAGLTDPFPQKDHGAVDKKPSQKSPILMIGRDPTLLSYKAAVLATANFRVQSVSPTQAQAALEDCANYRLVIFSHTLEANEVFEMQHAIRARKPDAKLLLLLGPGDTPLDCNMFDATFRGLDGPAAFIRTVGELIGKGA